MVAESIQSEGGSRHEPRPRRRHAHPVMRGDDEGFVVCECPGCSGCEPPCQRPARWWQERADEAIQLCGTCANRRVTVAERKAVLRRLDAEPEGEDEPTDPLNEDLGDAFCGHFEEHEQLSDKESDALVERLNFAREQQVVTGAAP